MGQPRSAGGKRARGALGSSFRVELYFCFLCALYVLCGSKLLFDFCYGLLPAAYCLLNTISLLVNTLTRIPFWFRVVLRTVTIA